MKKPQLIRLVAKESGVTITETTKIINTLIEVMKQELSSGENIKISRFGIFEIKDIPSRIRMIPGTDTEVFIPENKIVTFKAFEDLKDRINKKKD